MSEYKETLNLPSTEFPMKANLAEREVSILKKWEAGELYKKCREHGKKRKKFILLDGPPYANGHIHIGHVVNKVLKDFVTKSKTFSGYDAPYIPGWDCHGLPIELNVEKKLGKPGQKISLVEFRKACRDYALTQIDFQRDEFKRLGVMGDWDNPYLTMDFKFEANIIRALGKIFKNGHVVQGRKPVYWCLDCASALAEAEVEYRDKNSLSIDVRFQVVDEKAFIERFKGNVSGTGPISIPIWTTTPWTLPANQGVMLNPFLEYCLVECEGKERLLIAEPLVKEVCKRYQIEHSRIIGKTLGENLEQLLLRHPFYPKEVPVLLADFVTVDSGTGAVHSAPSHGPDDFNVAARYSLSLLNLLGNDGCFTKEAGFIAGLHVTKVESLILEELKKGDNLLHLAKITHSYPHCWRHKTPLIYRATKQWFISMEQNQLREKVLTQIHSVKWIPDWGSNRIYSMVQNRPDWCISRQRFWGTPIPIFLHKETDAPHPETLRFLEEIAKRMEHEGIEAWFALDINELIGHEAKEYYKCADTLDVWFDSGVVFECLHRDLAFPVDLVLEGSDQHRGWFNSSLTTSVAIHGVAPFQSALTHGFVIDLEGRKMSKSLGNVIAPDTIIRTLGADILRLWVSSIDYRGDIFISDEILKRISETYRRLRNTARFLLGNLVGFDPKKHGVSFTKMLALDRAILDKARLLQQEIIEAYEAFQFHLIYQKVQQFCSVDLGSFYLDIIKDRQYTTQKESLARRSTQTAMFHLIEAMVRWLAPILSFTAEEIWHYIPGARTESVFLNEWYKDLPVLKEDELMNQAFWGKVRLVRDAVNKEIERLRNEGKLGSSLEASVRIYCEPDLKQTLDALGNELRFVLITSGAKVYETKHHEANSVFFENLELWISVDALLLMKCDRCWHRSDDIGQNKKHPTLCARCIENVDGTGEVRLYA